ncbi:MAG: right-handed parallel beta-helix repeat-containing protein [Thermodesulfobacteriota bacterium]
MATRAFIFLLAMGFCLLPAVSGARVINVPSDAVSVQGAVEAAAPNDTIIVSDGHYIENVLIRKPLIIRSQNGNSSTIITAKDRRKAVVKIEGVKGGEFSGFTVKGSAVAGLHVRGASGVKVSSVLAMESYTGIFVEESSGSVFSENTARGNTDGIAIQNSNNNVFEKNHADSNAEKGFLLVSASANRIENNTADSNYWNGITLWSSHSNVLRNNTAYKNTYGIVISKSENNELEGNKTMRRLYFLLPVALIYIGVIFYFIERRLLLMYYAGKK